MTANDRHTKSSRKKRPHVLDQVQGHEAGAGRPQGGLGGGFPLPTARQWLAWTAGLGLSCLANGSLRQRVLLARPFLPEGKNPGAKQSLLEQQVRGEQGPGRTERPTPPPRRLVSLDHLGVFPVEGSVAGGGDTKIAGCPPDEARAALGLGSAWPEGAPSIRPGVADNLAPTPADSRRLPPALRGCRGRQGPALRPGLAGRHPFEPVHGKPAAACAS